MNRIKLVIIILAAMLIGIIFGMVPISTILPTPINVSLHEHGSMPLHSHADIPEALTDDFIHIIVYHPTGHVVLIFLVGSGVLLLLMTLNVKRKASELQESRDLYKNTMESSLVGIYIIQDLKFVYVNQAMAEMFGYAPTEMIGMSPADIVAPEHHDLVAQRLTERAQGAKGFPYDVRCVRRDQSTFIGQVWGKSSTFNGKPGSVGTLVDVTKRVQAEKELELLAYYDPLTKLPNRSHFAKHANEVLTEARELNYRFIIILIDLDNFKRINDTLGHQVGDRVLQEVAIRLTDVLSSETDKKCFLSRLGGDEFVGISKRIENIAHAGKKAETLMTELRRVFIVDEKEIRLTVSAGIALYPYDGTDIHTLMKAADLALYDAKDRGKNTFRFYEPSLNVRIEEHVHYEGMIKYLIDTEDFQIAFQPIFNVDLNKICSVEALFRPSIKYKQYDLERLFQIAEDTGLIIPLGEKILAKIMKECKQFVDYDEELSVSFNLSSKQLSGYSNIEWLITAIRRANISPTRIIIEITESILLNFTDIRHSLAQIRQHGLRVAIDDFGKGYSSMSYLKELPVSKLKIDKGFIFDLEQNERSQEITKAIISLTKSLNLVCCAEGVETEGQLNLLREYRCDQFQGYYFELQPTTSEKIMEFLRLQREHELTHEEICLENHLRKLQIESSTETIL